MDFVNRIASSVYSVLEAPLGFLAPELRLVLISGIFGIIALVLFKFISFQKGVKEVKDKIKGGIIAIRIYQNDLGEVSKNVGMVLLRNIKYLAMNFLPILPLMVPFVLLAAQLVTHYGFAPLPVEEGVKGTVVELAMKAGEESQVSGMSIELPDTLEARTPLVRNSFKGLAWIEVAPTAPGEQSLAFVLADGTRVEKSIHTGELKDGVALQPERVAGFLPAWLWPAEDTLKGTPVETIKFVYPERELRWMPDGPVGVLLTLLVASMAFGVLILKPLNIQI